MYSALDLSRYIVSKCISDGHPITNLQLQKILYFIQRDYLEHGKKAFSVTPISPMVLGLRHFKKEPVITKLFLQS